MLMLMRLAALLLALAPLFAAASGEDRLGRVDAWPAVTVLGDPGGKLRAEDVLAAPDRFTVPASRIRINRMVLGASGIVTASWRSQHL